MAKEDLEQLEVRIAEGEKREKAAKKQALKKRRREFWTDFRKFITKGNIIDLAVAVVIGAAFNAIVSSAVNDLITPIISLLTGGIDMTTWKLILVEAYTDANGKQIAEVALQYGNLLQATMRFLVIAMFVFLVMRFRVKAKTKITFGFFEHQREEEEKKKALEKQKAEQAKAEAEKAAEEVRAEKEQQHLFYENVRRQTELLEAISERLNQS